MRAATGVAFSAPLPARAGGRSIFSAAGWTGPSGPVAGAASAPAAIRQTTVPTATVSSGWTRISAIVPATGAGSSASTLSVEISTSGSSTATASPTLTSQSNTVPSATESPISGMATSTSSPSAEAGSGGAEASSGGAASAGGAGAAPFPSASISPRTAPTATVESGSARIFVSVPAAGAGTSASTLSVETSTRGSSASTRSPTCFSHSRIVPSVTDSPIWGIVICTVVARVAIPSFNDTPPGAGRH
jgi:hypothetical protein